MSKLSMKYGQAMNMTIVARATLLLTKLWREPFGRTRPLTMPSSSGWFCTFRHVYRSGTEPETTQSYGDIVYYVSTIVGGLCLLASDDSTRPQNVRTGPGDSIV